MKKKKVLKLDCKSMNRIFIGTILILLIIIGCIIKYAYDQKDETTLYKETSYNMAFDELVYYVQSLENWLAKATISSSSKNGTQTLTEISKESELAVNCLSQVPLSTNELTKTAKFLNQVSEYARKFGNENTG